MSLDSKIEHLLQEITYEVGFFHTRKETSTKNLEAKRGEFFSLATTKAKMGTLAQRTLHVNAPTDAIDPKTWAERKYPLWEVVEASGRRFDWDFLLVERPEFTPFTFTNPRDGKVYQRQVVEGNMILDDELLQATDNELWLSVSEYSGLQAMAAFLMYSIDHVEYTDAISMAYDFLRQEDAPRALLPLEQLTEDQMADLDFYFYQKEPTLKLAKPRVAKPEELPGK